MNVLKINTIGANRRLFGRLFLYLAKVTPVVVLLSIFISLAAPSTGFAAFKYESWSVEKKATAYQYALILDQCFKGNSIHTGESHVSAGDFINAFNWSSTNYVTWDPTIVSAHSTLQDDNEGACSENDSEIISSALSYLGVSPIEFACALGMDRSNNSATENCVQQSGDFKMLSGKNPRQEVGNALRDLNVIDIDNPGSAARFIRNLRILEGGCLGSEVTLTQWQKEGSNTAYDIKTYPSGGMKYYLSKSTKDKKPLGANDKEKGTVNCQTYYDRHGSYYNGYAAYMIKSSSDELEKKENEARDDSSDAEAGAGATTCVIEGIGWIICPIVTAGAKATDALYGWISSFLKIPALNMDTASNTNTAYIAWKTVRNVANVAFVIAFLIIIFSQLTGAGVSNYGVKKMLPRLIIASILVNTSYWITAIAVDISNIAGENIYNLLRTIELGDISPQDNIAEVVTAWVLGGASAGLVVWGGLTVAAAGSAAVAGMGAALLWFLVPVILAAALALFVAFTILALRHALIIILIVVSPLAFVAFLLPNTEKFFDMWRKSLITLLVFYPLFSMLFGGSYVASMIIIGSAGGSDENAATGMLIPLALAIQFIPLFLTPLLIKFSTGVMGTVAGMVNNKNKGLIDRSKRIRDRKANLAANETLGSNRATRNPFARAARSLYRRSQNSTFADTQRKTNYESANKAAFLETERASELNVTGAQTGQLISALESEQNAEALETADTATQLRKRLADDKSKLATLNQDARYAESKVTQGPGGGAGDIERDIRVASSRAASASNIMNQNYASDLQNSEALRREAGGVDPRGAARVAAAAAATISKADDDAMAAAAVPIKEGLETVKANGGDPDDYLRKAITDASTRGDTDSLSAALDLTASLGRTGVIREARANPSIDSVAVQRAISANAGALIGKAPDLVKGTGAAFETVKGNDLVSFSKDTIKSYTNYLEGKLAAGDIQGFNDSYTAFSNAVEDIRKNPTLQAQFGGDIGREIIKSFQNTANLAAYAPSSIDPISGKIR